jgi:hypothetical protein
MQFGTALQLAQVSAAPLSFRYVPEVQATHCEVVGLPQVSGETQPATGAHGTQTSAIPLESR